MFPTRHGKGDNKHWEFEFEEPIFCMLCKSKVLNGEKIHFCFNFQEFYCSTCNNKIFSWCSRKANFYLYWNKEKPKFEQHEHFTVTIYYRKPGESVEKKENETEDEGEEDGDDE